MIMMGSMRVSIARRILNQRSSAAKKSLGGDFRATATSLPFSALGWQ